MLTFIKTACWNLCVFLVNAIDLCLLIIYFLLSYILGERKNTTVRVIAGGEAFSWNNSKNERNPYFCQVVTDVLSTELGIRISFVEPPEFRGGGETPHTPPLCTPLPWLRGYHPHILFSLSSVLNWICWTPPRTKFLGTPLVPSVDLQVPGYGCECDWKHIVCYVRKILYVCVLCLELER
jgi:hypothetical protein